jgi:hypothetical protein
MIVRYVTRCACLGVLAALLGAPAAALESTSGAYEGKLVCKGITSGDREKTKEDVEVGVFDDGAGGVLLEIGTLGTFEGFLLTDSRKPETGTLSAVSCTLNVATQTGRALHAEMKIKAGSEKGKLKGKLIRMDLPGEAAALCELKAERVSTLGPKLAVCL